MKERLKTALIEGVGLDGKTAEKTVSAVAAWIDDEDRSNTKTIRTDSRLVVGKIEDDSLSLSITESTNVAGASIVEPGAKSYIVKFPLETNS